MPEVVLTPQTDQTEIELSSDPEPISISQNVDTQVNPTPILESVDPVEEATSSSPANNTETLLNEPLVTEEPPQFPEETSSSITEPNTVSTPSPKKKSDWFDFSSILVERKPSSVKEAAIEKPTPEPRQKVTSPKIEPTLEVSEPN